MVVLLVKPIILRNKKNDYIAYLIDEMINVLDKKCLEDGCNINSAILDYLKQLSH
jgi:hypothetical protein